MATTKAKKLFSWRAFTSILLFWTGLVMAVSGIILYIAPTGRVARAAIWTFWGLDKDGWGAVHTILSFLFTIFAVLHIVLNWKPLISYLKDRVTRVVRLRREWVGATLISILACALTILAVPPFQSVMDWGEQIKEGWEQRLLQGSDILPHTENFTLEEFARNYRVDKEEVRRVLTQLGITTIKADDTFGDFASALETTPLALYKQISTKITPPKGEATAEPPASGMGRMTVASVAQRLGIAVDAALERLRAAGIDARADSQVKHLAEVVKKTPLEIYRLVQGQTEKTQDQKKNP